MRYVGLVRNVLLGRQGLDRELLLRLLDAAGARSGQSHLTTGNVTFEAAPVQLDTVVRRLEDGIASAIGRREPVVVRTVAWLRDLVVGDPFAAFPADRWELSVVFLPERSPALEVLPPVQGLAVVAVRPHELLVAGRSDRPRAGPARLLAPPWRGEATTRSWGTVRRLAVAGGGAQPRTTSIGSMPSSGGSSKPHTCA